MPNHSAYSTNVGSEAEGFRLVIVMWQVFSESSKSG
jgi:hypothetical protein